ncbi:MAG TPA: Asp23/Gls24 family envelope stress response protein [Bacilli bacterium]|nr:Asp23/Gls24 family envelope stress response protein [Bacilli bacterium]
MAQYVHIQNYNKQGLMGISQTVFDQIAEIATNEVSGATVMKKRGFTLFEPVHCHIRNGEVTVKIAIKVNAGVNVKTISKTVQESIAQSLNMMTEHIPFKILIDVRDVIA